MAKKSLLRRMLKMSVKELIWKTYKTLHNSYVISHRNEENYYSFYKSYKHINNKIKNQTNLNVVQYMTARPNPGAGIGHQIANWCAGFWFAKKLGLEFVHIPFSSQRKPFYANEWDYFLNFGYGSKLYSDVKQTNKTVLLPLFDENNEQEVETIKEIIKSYEGEKVVFLLEQDQFFRNLQYIKSDLQERFNALDRSEWDKKLLFSKKKNVVVHTRRGDIVQSEGKDNPNLTMRFQGLDYFQNVLDQILAGLDDYELFIISQGKKEDFSVFDQYRNVHYILNEDDRLSFYYMIKADILITSKSSFSYKPALLNENGIKICPKDFWHGYPEDEKWLLADNEGHILNKLPV